MVDAQTRRSIETMCQCGIDFDGLKGCFSKIDESILKEIYEDIQKQRGKSADEPTVGVSCNCS